MWAQTFNAGTTQFYGVRCLCEPAHYKLTQLDPEKKFLNPAGATYLSVLSGVREER